jgi:hypothetical protein
LVSDLREERGMRIFEKVLRKVHGLKSGRHLILGKTA